MLEGQWQGGRGTHRHAGESSREVGGHQRPHQFTYATPAAAASADWRATVLGSTVAMLT